MHARVCVASYGYRDVYRSEACRVPLSVPPPTAPPATPPSAPVDAVGIAVAVIASTLALVLLALLLVCWRRRRSLKRGTSASTRTANTMPPLDYVDASRAARVETLVVRDAL